MPTAIMRAMMPNHGSSDSEKVIGLNTLDQQKKSGSPTFFFVHPAARPMEATVDCLEEHLSVASLARLRRVSKAFGVSERDWLRRSRRVGWRRPKRTSTQFSDAMHAGRRCRECGHPRGLLCKTSSGGWTRLCAACQSDPGNFSQLVARPWIQHYARTLRLVVRNVNAHWGLHLNRVSYAGLMRAVEPTRRGRSKKLLYRLRAIVAASAKAMLTGA